MFIPELKDLKNESDVEQKFIMPFLKEALGYYSHEIKTKEYLAPSVIDKGAGKKLGYYPDYTIYLGSIPVIVIEAKDPNADLEEGYREARLYANEINKLYPEKINPVKYVISSNGHTLLYSPADSEYDLKTIQVENLIQGQRDFNFICVSLSRQTLIKHVYNLRRKLIPVKRFKPLRLIGGPSRQKAELPSNTFAVELVPFLRKYFDPDETKWSREFLEKAYCSSDELTKYNSTLEALLKDRIFQKQGFSQIITSKKDAPVFNKALKKAVSEKKDIPDPFILIIGSVGSGKSMFLERYHTFLIDADIKCKTIWAIIDFNNAPDDLENLENWICSELVRDISQRNGNENFFDFDNLKRYFAPDIAFYERGPYKLLRESDNAEYIKRITDDIKTWTDNSQKLSSGITRYYSKDKNIPVIAVFDNVDKRDKDQQLKIFQTVQWFRSNNKCFTILTLRDETYDAYRNEPPLDAFLKTFAFRIMPPRFINVVKKRLELIINYLSENTEKKLKYTLPNGMQITYPSTNLGKYILSIYLSVFNPSRKIRLILEALSGRNIRSALEMFTDILTSGYMNEDLIFSITEGQKREIPEWLVIRILMRTKYEFFSDSHGYIQNLFDLPEESLTANNFLILELLEFLARRRKNLTNFKIEGYIYVPDIKMHMVKLGYIKEDIMWALEKLLNRGLISADHQRLRNISDSDYVRITASGYYHIRFLSIRTEYLSGVIIDTWINDETLARKISKTPGDKKIHRIERLKLFKEYLANQSQILDDALPEFSSTSEIINEQIERIEKAIQFKI